MSLEKRLTRDRRGDFVLTIKVTGEHDIYRFASHMLNGQVEFCRAGRLALRSLRDHMTAPSWNYLLHALGGPAKLYFGAKRQAR